LLILWLTLAPIMAHFDEVWMAAQLLMCDVLQLQCQLNGSVVF
jgi:flagellar biosynthetic protein FliR